jgi:hypothetical protein
MRLIKMDNSDWNKLHEMHILLNENGLTAFDTNFLELYSKLLAESLRGKGNETKSTAPCA